MSSLNEPTVETKEATWTEGAGKADEAKDGAKGEAEDATGIASGVALGVVRVAQRVNETSPGKGSGNA